MLVDSHCHIHDVQFFPDNREEVYTRSREAGVRMVCIGTSEGDSRQAVQFVADRDDTWAVVGVHPHDTKDGWQDIGRLLSEKPAKIVGIGEIGLDYFYDNSPRDVQQRALEEQLQWAVDYDLPVSFHVREAYDDFWPIFDNFSGVRGALHSFTDNQANLEQGFSRGLFVGLNGISTFTRDDNQRQMYYNVPPNRLLLETDAPYLTPRPLRGKMNEPRYVELVAKYWSSERNIDFDKLCQVTQDNTRLLFGI